MKRERNRARQRSAVSVLRRRRSDSSTTRLSPSLDSICAGEKGNENAARQLSAVSVLRRRRSGSSTTRLSPVPRGCWCGGEGERNPARQQSAVLVLRRRRSGSITRTDPTEGMEEKCKCQQNPPIGEFLGLEQCFIASAERFLRHKSTAHSFDSQLGLGEFLLFGVPGEGCGAREFARPNRHHDVNGVGIVGLRRIE